MRYSHGWQRHLAHFPQCAVKKVGFAGEFLFPPPKVWTTFDRVCLARAVGVGPPHNQGQKVRQDISLGSCLFVMEDRPQATASRQDEAIDEEQLVNWIRLAAELEGEMLF